MTFTRVSMLTTAAAALLMAWLVVSVFGNDGYGTVAQAQEAANCPINGDPALFETQVKEQAPAAVRTVLTGGQADFYLQSFNAIPPVTQWAAEVIWIYTSGQMRPLMVTIINDRICRGASLGFADHERIMDDLEDMLEGAADPTSFNRPWRGLWQGLTWQRL